MGGMSKPIKPQDTRTLDQIITDNAHLWLRRRVAARRVEHEEYTLRRLAAEMMPHMVSAEEREKPDFDAYTASDRIMRTVRTYLGLGRSRGARMPWRADYIDGFCKAMGKDYADIVNRSIALNAEDRDTLDSMHRFARWLAPYPWPPKGSR